MAEEKKLKELKDKIDKCVLQEKLENKKDSTIYYAVPTDSGAGLQKERPSDLSQSLSTTTLSCPLTPNSPEFISNKRRSMSPSIQSIPPIKKEITSISQKEKIEITDKFAHAILNEFQNKEDGLKRDILRSLNLMRTLDQQINTLMYLMEEPFAMWMTGYSREEEIQEQIKKEPDATCVINKKQLEEAFGKKSGPDVSSSDDKFALNEMVKEELDEIIETAEKVTKSMSSPLAVRTKNRIQKYAYEDLTIERIEKALYHIYRRIMLLSLRKREISRNMLDRVTDAYIRLRKSTMTLKERYPETIPNSNPYIDVDEDIEKLLDAHTLNQIFTLAGEVTEDKLNLDYLELDDTEKKEIENLEQILKRPTEEILGACPVGQSEPDSPKSVIRQIKQSKLPGLFNDLELESEMKEMAQIQKAYKDANVQQYQYVSEFSPEKHIIENVKRRKYNTIEGKKQAEMTMNPSILNAVLSYQPVNLNNEGKMFLDVVDTLYGKMIRPPKGFSHSSKSPQAEGNVLKLEGISSDLVGLSAEIYWPDDGLWYFVHINSIDLEKKTADIIYTTGETELLDLIEIVTEGHMLIID